ncbi:hypothetical protein [Streptomyces sp. NPDC059010]|uniref:hypothetical protein n=1 Tax=Streptomyces sp. NPDC059010 TaxID=3346695 RepID=UPI0036D00E13
MSTIAMPGDEPGRSIRELAAALQLISNDLARPMRQAQASAQVFSALMAQHQELHTAVDKMRMSTTELAKILNSVRLPQSRLQAMQSWVSLAEQMRAGLSALDLPAATRTTATQVLDEIEAHPPQVSPEEVAESVPADMVEELTDTVWQLDPGFLSAAQSRHAAAATVAVMVFSLYLTLGMTYPAIEEVASGMGGLSGAFPAAVAAYWATWKAWGKFHGVEDEADEEP